MSVKVYLSNSSMTNSPLMIIVIFMTAVFGFHIGTAFAMHDSNLDVNTWLASDNSTQLQTIDLNKGPVSPTTATGASTPEQTTDESTEEEEDVSAADENGDETASANVDEEQEEEEEDGNTIVEDENGEDGNGEEEN